jgi:GNAT superfamily N-acetyltransferase
MKDFTAQNFFTIRKAQPEDMPAIHSLVRELALFEKEPDAVITNPEEYLKDMENGWFESLVALTDENEIAGMALFHRAYSSWKGKMIYLDDLIVTEKFRGQGAGRLLLESLIQYAKSQDARLLKWQVLDWNADAINFYKGLGVDFEDEWLNCKMFLTK